MSAGSWLDDQAPHDSRRSKAQIRRLLKLLGNRPRHVLDLGCGCGRVLVPLARAGHRVIGIDRRAELLRKCAESLSRFNGEARLMRSDFVRRWPRLPRRQHFDAVLCLGNTFLTIADIDQALRLMGRVRAILKPRGRFIIDDLPGEFWPELASGNWVNGMSPPPDDSMQLIWHQRDAVFAIRRGRAIDRQTWTLKPSDRRLRLWCDGSLTLAARLAGLSAPQRLAAAGLLVFERSKSAKPRAGASRR